MWRSPFFVLLALGLQGQAPAWDYRARLDASAATVSVEARFAADDADRFTLDDGFAPFVKGLEQEQQGSWTQIPRDGDGWNIAGAERRGAHLRWDFDLAAAEKIQRRMAGPVGKGGAWLARPSAFLLRPAQYYPDRRARLRMALSEGTTFLCGLRPGSEPNSWEADTDDFNDPPYSALGRWRVHELKTGGSSLQIAEPESGLPMSEALADGWIQRSAGLLVSGYGRFPVSRAALILVPVERGKGVVFGTASGHGGAGVIVLLGRSVSGPDLEKDWVLTHELIHLALPDLAGSHRWLEEGLPTYLEPLLRLRAGQMGVTEFWSDLRANLPKGQPGSGDRGLDRTATWGRTYWGGAMFCFLADLQIRQRSAGRKTLLDAVRGIIESGRTAETRAEIRDVLRSGDRALGFKVLEPLYDRLARDPAPADLEAIWKKLGVAEVSFDEAAPEAGLRRSWGR